MWYALPVFCGIFVRKRVFFLVYYRKDPKAKVLEYSFGVYRHSTGLLFSLNLYLKNWNGIYTIFSKIKYFIMKYSKVLSFVTTWVTPGLSLVTGVFIIWLVLQVVRLLKKREITVFTVYFASSLLYLRIYISLAITKKVTFKTFDPSLKAIVFRN